MATHSSNLAWRIPWTEGPGGLQSKGLQRVRRNSATNNLTFKSKAYLDYGYPMYFGFRNFVSLRIPHETDSGPSLSASGQLKTAGNLSRGQQRGTPQ